MFIFSFIISPVLFSHAFNMKVSSMSNEVSKKVTSEQQSLQVVQKILTCTKAGRNISEIKKCASDFLSNELSNFQKNKLLANFEIPFEISRPKLCEAKQVELIPEAITNKAYIMLCSAYENYGLTDTLYFIFIKDQGKIKLYDFRR